MSAATPRPNGTARATASTSIASTAAPARSRHVQRLGGLENPSFLAINADGTRLYSVHGDRSEANSFTIDRGTGHLAPLNRQSTGGYNPVHLAFDATGRFLAICNYGSDSLAVLPVAADGSLMPYRTLTTVTGTLGPHRFQQRTMCVHHIPLDRQGRFFYVPCKGSDVVIAYRLDTRRRVLVEAARVAARPGAAPRHIDFPSAQGAGLCHQRARFDAHDLPARPQDRRAHAAADDSLHAFRLHRLQHRRRDLGRSRRPQRLCLQSRPRQHRRVRHRSAKGTLSPRQWVPTQGGTPRFFTFDPAQRFLYVANQDGRSIVGYRVGRDGLLAATRIRVKVGSPACIVFSH